MGRFFETRCIMLELTVSQITAKNESVHNYNTRQKCHFHFYGVNSEVEKKCIRHEGSKLWNLLPTNLKNIYSKSLFQRKLKKLYLPSLE